MPRPSNLVETEILLKGGFFPSVPDVAPGGLQETINAGSNVWVRPKGKIEVARGLLEVSSQNVGARLFAADIQRASIEGGLSGSRLPYAGFLRYQNACLFFLSEETDAQVYLDEAAIPGLTTASSPGKLRVAIPDGLGGYNTFDAGFDKPIPSLVQLSPNFGVRDMKGAIGIAIARWRSQTPAIGPPSDVEYFDVPPGTNSVIGVQLPAAVSGQDGWIVAGTRWGDRSGTLRIVRYVYTVPRGTFTATNGSPNLTAGVGTRWTFDLGRADGVVIDGGAYLIDNITADGTAVLTSNFTGSTGAGKTMTIATIGSEWYDGELGKLVSRDVQAPFRAAGVLGYGGRVFIWGVPDTQGVESSLPTGNAILAMEENNPEHCGLLAIVTASGSDLVNVLAGDGPMYLMTTTSLEVVNFTGSADTPFVIRIVAEPGFKDATNGCLYKDYFYGYSNKPLRTRARENIDVEFGEAVLDNMADWTGRVIVREDPDNAAVLYIHDDGNASEVIPWMTQFEQWGPPINFSARIVDAAVVNGHLYVTYLDSGVYRVNQWEGGSGIGGTRYAATQFLDPNRLNSNRLKQLTPVGKLTSLSVYRVQPGEAVPDVTDLGQAAATFPLSDTANMSEPPIYTNIAGQAYAFRFNFGEEGTFSKLVVGGLPRGSK